MNKNQNHISDNEHVIHHTKTKIISEYQKDPARVVNDLMNSISGFLSNEVEPLLYKKYRPSFESNCQRALFGILIAQFEKEQAFLIFPDIIPGFTTLTYKKDLKYFTRAPKESKKSLLKSKQNKDNAALQGDNGNNSSGTEGASDNVMSESTNHIFNSFFQKNNQLVLMVESEEILMMFCPVADFDKYIKQLEAYSMS